MPERKAVASSGGVNFDAEAAIDRVLRMMAIPGKSGEEAAVVKFITEALLEAGLPKRAIVIDQASRKSPVGGQTGSLIVTLAGTERAPRRLLMAHVDTVPLCVGARPVKKGNVIRSADPTTALGADDRSGAAVVLTAAIEILRQNLPHPPLTFFWPVQEEIGLFGARFVPLAHLGQPKLCFNWDGGSAATVCIGATGAYDLRIAVEGIASHAGVHPEAGVSAIAMASLAVADLQQNGWHGLILKGNSTGTSNIGVIAGGDATNVVTPLIELRGEVRSHDGRFRRRLVDEFRRAFERAAKKVRNDAGRYGRVRFSADQKYESFRLSENEPCVQEALRVIRAVGLHPVTRISNGGLDANWMSARGLPTVTLGSGQNNVHTVDEFLKVDDFINGCRIGLTLALGS